jgi:hypothetical protein
MARLLFNPLDRSWPSPIQTNLHLHCCRLVRLLFPPLMSTQRGQVQVHARMPPDTRTHLCTAPVMSAGWPTRIYIAPSDQRRQRRPAIDISFQRLLVIRHGRRQCGGVDELSASSPPRLMDALFVLRHESRLRIFQQAAARIPG